MSVLTTKNTTDSSPQGDSVTLRRPLAADGREIWQLVSDSGVLDLNSSYCYLMMCEFFPATCVVAEEDGRCVGFATCFIDPKREDRLFVWQVGVAAEQRGKGLASRMLLEVLRRPENRQARFVEATIGPSNKASLALFTGLARRYGTEIRQQGGFTPEMFPGAGHEAEDLYIIGPFDAANPEA